jgi:hypothetical protein
MAGCPPSGVGELERTGRIVVLEPDLAYEASTYRTIEQIALDLAGRAPLTPAALRDATGTSRKFVMAILADLDRRGVLRRTAAGHVPGPRAATARAEAQAATARAEAEAATPRAEAQAATPRAEPARAEAPTAMPRAEPARAEAPAASSSAAGANRHGSVSGIGSASSSESGNP